MAWGGDVSRVADRRGGVWDVWGEVVCGTDIISGVKWVEGEAEPGLGPAKE